MKLDLRQNLILIYLENRLFKTASRKRAPKRRLLPQSTSYGSLARGKIRRSKSYFDYLASALTANRIHYRVDHATDHTIECLRRARWARVSPLALRTANSHLLVVSGVNTHRLVRNPRRIPLRWWLRGRVVKGHSTCPRNRAEWLITTKNS